MATSGRWHRQGMHVVYTAESSALAMLEVLANLETVVTPPSFQLLEIDAPDDLTVTDWPAGQDHRDQSLTAEWGDAFLRAGKTPLARVPSVVAPESSNFLLNPQHPDAARVRITRAARWPWDARLFEGGPAR